MPSCRRCHAKKLKCSPGTTEHSCAKCEQLGLLCEYPVKWKACIHCHTAKKKCAQAPNSRSCLRCIALALACFARTEGSDEALINELEQTTGDSNETFSIENNRANLSPIYNMDVAHSYLGLSAARTSPFYSISTSALQSFVPSPNKNLDIEDQDLLPTIEDWKLVFNYLTKNGTVYPQAASFDAEIMLSNYFNKPAELRLILCCWALYQNQRDEDSAMKYFDRARKALSRATLAPSLDLLITYNLICDFAITLGKPYITEQFLLNAMKVIKAIQLDVDPDDTPSVRHLTVRQKEERRRAFWYCFRSYLSLLHVSPSHSQAPISFDKVKVPGQVYDPLPVFSEYEKTLKAHLQILEVLGFIKEMWAIPPIHAHDLFSSVDSLSIINSKIMSLAANIDSLIPKHFLLSFDDPEDISLPEQFRIISQTLSSQENLCSLNMSYLSSISILYRPIIFLTALPSCRPQFLSPSHRNIIINATNTVTEMALRVGCLFKFAHAMIQNNQSISKEDAHLFDVFYATYEVFESFVCGWFCNCRMDPAWLPYLRYGETNTPELRFRIRYLLDSYANVAVYQTTIPLRKTMYAMLDEMEEVAKTGKRRPVSGGDEIGEMDLVELKMIYPYLQNREEKEKTVISEPYCFLGLLGMDVGSKLRWKGRSEDSWRLFWKMNA